MRLGRGEGTHPEESVISHAADWVFSIMGDRKLLNDFKKVSEWIRFVVQKFARSVRLQSICYQFFLHHNTSDR